MDHTKEQLRLELHRVERELQELKSYYSERAATELMLVVFGFALGIWAGYVLGLSK